MKETVSCVTAQIKSWTALTEMNLQNSKSNYIFVPRTKACDSVRGVVAKFVQSGNFYASLLIIFLDISKKTYILVYSCIQKFSKVLSILLRIKIWRNVNFHILNFLLYYVTVNLRNAAYLKIHGICPNLFNFMIISVIHWWMLIYTTTTWWIFEKVKLLLLIISEVWYF